jgi:hypothetical protein
MEYNTVNIIIASSIILQFHVNKMKLSLKHFTLKYDTLAYSNIFTNSSFVLQVAKTIFHYKVQTHTYISYHFSSSIESVVKKQLDMKLVKGN